MYRLITAKTVEERILERAKQKAKVLRIKRRTHRQIQCMVISDGNYEFSNDEQLWEANEVADLLTEDDVGQLDKKRKRPMAGFVVPKKREKKSSPKKQHHTTTTQHTEYESQQQLFRDTE